MDDMKPSHDGSMNIPSHETNLPDICQSSAMADVNISGDDQPDSDHRLEFEFPNRDIKSGGNLSVDIQGDIEGEDIIKPVEGSVNFADRPSDHDRFSTQTKPDASAELSFEDIDLTCDDNTKTGFDAELNVDGDIRNLDIENKDAVQEVHESEVCVHSTVSASDVPSISLEDKLAALAALSADFEADVPSQPLEVDVDVDAPKPGEFTSPYAEKICRSSSPKTITTGNSSTSQDQITFLLLFTEKYSFMLRKDCLMLVSD